MHPLSYRILGLVLVTLPCRVLVAQDKDWDIELSGGYATGAREPLLDFLEDWREASKPVSAALLEKKPAFERAVYDLYRAFFRPAEGLYENTQFIVIQNEIEVHIVDSDLSLLADADSLDRESVVRKLPEVCHISCMDFRPQVDVDGKKLLYLEYRPLGAMLGFLIEGNGYRISNCYWREDCESEKRKDRLRYLNSAMAIIPGHWGGWHFETHPYVMRIYLSADFQRALLLYRVHYGGGEALMVRNGGGGWELVSMQDTWVE